MEKSQHIFSTAYISCIFNEDQLMKALVWPVATYGCESWTLRKNEETRLDAFEMKGLRKIVRVSWTAKKTQARKATHGLDGQDQDVDRTLRGRVSQNDRGQG